VHASRIVWAVSLALNSYTKGVTLDLTRSAAQAIGMQGTGAVCMAKM